MSLRYRRAISIEEHGPRTCRALIQGKDISAHGPPAKWEASGFESFDITGDHISPGYIIRHTAISLLLHSGADPFAVQKLAGHWDVRLTSQTYAHVQTEAYGGRRGCWTELAWRGKEVRAPRTVRKRLLEVGGVETRGGSRPPFEALATGRGNFTGSLHGPQTPCKRQPYPGERGLAGIEL